MPINETNVKKAEETLTKLTSQMGPPDQRTSSNIDALRAGIDQHYRSVRPVGEDGKLTADAPSSNPNVVDAGGPLDYNQWYEPSVDSVRQRLASDPKLVERLGLQSWTSSPDQIESIDEHASAYTAIADDDWKQAAEKARQEGRNLKRYSKIALTEDPIEKTVGFLGKHVPAIASAVGEYTNPFAGFQRSQFRDINADTPSEESIQEIQDRSPIGYGLGMFAGAAMPQSAGNLAVGQLMKMGNYAARQPVGKALIGAAGGALGSVIEGELDAADTELSSEDPSLDSYLSDASQRATGNAVLGGAMGGVGDLIAQGAKGLQKTMHESPRFEDVRKLEAAGGSTHPLRGVKVPENVQANISESGVIGAIGKPEDIAASRVAPKISEYVDRQASETYNAAKENLAKYHSSPEGMEPQRVTAPVKTMIDMVRQGILKGDLGTSSDAVPTISENIRRRLINLVERKDVSYDQFKNLKARYGDDIIDMDPSEADELFRQGPKETSLPSSAPEVTPDGTQVDSFEGQSNPFNPLGGPDGSGQTMIDTKIRPFRQEGMEVYEQSMSPGARARQFEGRRMRQLASGEFANVSSEQPVSSTGMKTVLIPKSANSQQIEQIQQAIAGEIEKSPEHKGWLNLIDRSFRTVRDKFKPNADTPIGETLEDGTELFGLSALQRAHSRAFEKLNQVKADTSADYGSAIHNKVRSFNTGGNFAADKELLNQARNIDNPPEFRAKFSDVDLIAEQSIKKYSSLPPIEQDAVQQYIRGKNRDVFLSGNSPEFESVLQNLNIDNPTSKGTLYRGQAIDESQLNQILANGEYNSNTHIPTTYSPDMAGIYPNKNIESGQVPVTFKFKRVNNGSSMMIDESTANVEEIIIPKGSYKVTGSSKDETGRHVIELVSDGGNTEQSLREVTGSAVAPSLKERSWFSSPKGVFQGAADAAMFRSDPILRTIGNVPENPFVQGPNTPAGRIQKYLFENGAKNMLNLEGGRFGRFGNEVNEMKDEQ
jgi:hypothetical protein